MKRQHRMAAAGLATVALAWGGTAAAQQHDPHIHEESLLHVTQDGQILFEPPPEVTDLTAAELEAATRLLRRSRAMARRFPTARAARALGYTPRRRLDRSVLMPHFTNDGHIADNATLDPRRPESLVYRRDRGGRLRLVAFMFRTAPGPTTHPAGRYLRWHAHGGCRRPRDASATARPHPDCPRGHVLHIGRTMMVHVWFTDDVARAFSFDPPGWPWAAVRG